MKIRNLRKQSTRATMIWAAGAILAATLSGAAAAHSFSVAISINFGGIENIYSKIYRLTQ